MQKCILSNIQTKEYRIPFRPEYILVEGPSGATTVDDMVSIAAPTGRDIPAYKFHLSKEAIALIAQQDEQVKDTMGFSKISVYFDACNTGRAEIVAERGIITHTEQNEHKWAINTFINAHGDIAQMCLTCGLNRKV